MNGRISGYISQKSDLKSVGNVEEKSVEEDCGPTEKRNHISLIH